MYIMTPSRGRVLTMPRQSSNEWARASPRPRAHALIHTELSSNTYHTQVVQDGRPTLDQLAHDEDPESLVDHITHAASPGDEPMIKEGRVYNMGCVRLNKEVRGIVHFILLAAYSVRS